MWKSEDSLQELASPRCYRHQTPTGAFWGNLFLQSPRNLGVALQKQHPYFWATLAVRNVSPVTLQSHSDHVTRTNAYDFR